MPFLCLLPLSSRFGSVIALYVTVISSNFVSYCLILFITVSHSPKIVFIVFYCIAKSGHSSLSQVAAHLSNSTWFGPSFTQPWNSADAVSTALGSNVTRYDDFLASFPVATSLSSSRTWESSPFSPRWRSRSSIAKQVLTEKDHWNISYITEYLGNSFPRHIFANVYCKYRFIAEFTVAII